MRIRAAFTYTAMWLAVTTTAVTLSWLGVRDVIRDAVLNEPNSPPLIAPAETPAATAPPGPARSPAPAPPPRPVTPPSPEPGIAPANVEGYDVRGGHVVLSLGPASASLVSATPHPGYEIRTETGADWLRVDLTSAAASSSVFATWHGQPPTVRVDER